MFNKLAKQLLYTYNIYYFWNFHSFSLSAFITMDFIIMHGLLLIIDSRIINSELKTLVNRRMYMRSPINIC